MHHNHCCWSSLPAPSLPAARVSAASRLHFYKCQEGRDDPQRLCCGLQLDRTLTSDQKRLDFRPPEDVAPPLDRPTEACQLATALLTALSSSAPQTLQGSNLTAFSGEARGPPCCWLAACRHRLIWQQAPCTRGPGASFLMGGGQTLKLLLTLRCRWGGGRMPSC